MAHTKALTSHIDTMTLDFHEHWKFHLGDALDAWQKEFDDSSWEDVSLPHDWSVALPFSEKYSSGTGYAAGGMGWYRGTFTLPETLRGKRVLITFDGIYKHSRIWCNGCYKGFHPNGYTPVSYDITNEVTFSPWENVITVSVDQTEISDSRWFTGAGITRKVRITVTEPIFLDEYGTFFTVSQADTECACLKIENRIRSQLSHAANFTVENQLLSCKGVCVLQTRKNILLNPGGCETVTFQEALKHPRLWSLLNPELYTLVTLLTDEEGNTFRAGSIRVGIRTFAFDADEGFFLNGENMKLQGVCLHHDAGALGAAVTREVWVRRLLKLKRMGCNAIRMSHNPHMPELYELCDEMGFLVIDEAFDEWEMPKNKWSRGHNIYPPKHQGYYQHFPDYHALDLRTMILRDRNHPSVILWSIGNEIDYPNDPYCHPLFQTMTGNNDTDKPEEELRYHPNRPNAQRLAGLAAMLAAEVRKTDTTHPVTLAAAFPELSSHLGFLDALDVAGYNYKEHLYPESHQRFPKLPFLGSENGHSLKDWKAVTENNYISGQFLWTGIDFLGEAHGWPYRASGAGLLTLAGFEKTGYYRRMSFWSREPMAHLATVRHNTPGGEWKPYLEHWNYADQESVEVVCYTNLPSAELFLNKESLGVHEKSSDEDGIRWIVPYQPGTLFVRAFGSFACRGGEELEAWDRLETTYAPCRLALTPFETPQNLSTEKESILQLEIFVLDWGGRLVSTDSSLITAEIEGAQFLGMENGDIADCTPYRSFMRRAYHGRLLLFCRRISEAPVTVTVRSEALAPAAVTIR